MAGVSQLAAAGGPAQILDTLEGEAHDIVEQPQHGHHVMVTSAEVIGGTAGSAIVSEDGRHYATHAKVVAGGSFRVRLGVATMAERSELVVLRSQSDSGLLVTVTAEGGERGVTVVPVEGGWLLQVEPEGDHYLLIDIEAPLGAPRGRTEVDFDIQDFVVEPPADRPLPPSETRPAVEVQPGSDRILLPSRSLPLV